jgi:hypothetical protein
MTVIAFPTAVAPASRAARSLPLDHPRRAALPADAEYVVYRLEEAGRSLLALPRTGYTTGLRCSSLDIVRGAAESYGWSERQLRPAIPSAAMITRMDEALCWISLIPQQRYVLRRIVGARALVSPVTERYLYSWRRLAALVGADHKAVQRWHAQAIDMIVTALNAAALDARPLGTGERGV